MTPHRLKMLEVITIASLLTVRYHECSCFLLNVHNFTDGTIKGLVGIIIGAIIAVLVCAAIAVLIPIICCCCLGVGIGTAASRPHYSNI